VTRDASGGKRPIDVGGFLVWARVLAAEEARALAAKLGWPEGGAVLGARLRLRSDGGVKPQELVEALTGRAPGADVRYARTALWACAAGEPRDPLSVELLP